MNNSVNVTTKQYLPDYKTPDRMTNIFYSLERSTDYMIQAFKEEI